MGVELEVVHQVTGELAEAFERLMPQLSRSAAPPDWEALARITAAPATTLLVARCGGEIVGSLTLALFEIPTGVRAWIEDVVVDEASRGQGIGQDLIREALRLAREAGAKTVDLTSRADRQAAGRLYERAGFQLRDTRVYRYQVETAAR